MSYEPENPSSDIGDDAQAWLSREHQAIQDEFNQLVAGRAGLLLDTPVADSTLLTQTPVKITGFDNILQPEILASANLSNSTLTINVPGLWFIAIKAIANIVSHTANYTRGVVMELYNETQAVTYKIVDYSDVARYATLVDFTISIPVYIPPSIVGDELAIYAYATTTNSVQLTGLQILEFEVVLLSRF